MRRLARGRRVRVVCRGEGGLESRRDCRLRTGTGRVGGLRDVVAVRRSCSATDIAVVCTGARWSAPWYTKAGILPPALLSPNRNVGGRLKQLLTSCRAFAVLALTVRLSCGRRDVRGKSVALPVLGTRGGERGDASRFERVARGEGGSDGGGGEGGRIVLEAAGRLVVGFGAGFALSRGDGVRG